MTNTNSSNNDSNNSNHQSTNILEQTTSPRETSASSPSSWLSLLLLLIGLLALSATAIFIKFSLREISSEATVFNRLWIATIVFAGWNWVWQPWRSPERGKDSKIDLETKEAPQNTGVVVILLVSLALVHLTGRFLWTWSLTQTTVANGTMLSNMPPIFTALGGWLFLRQRYDQRFLTGLGIALFGAITLSLGDWLQPKNSLFGTTAIIGDGAALLSSFFYAGSFLLVEKLRQSLTTSDILVWRCTIGLAVAAPLVWTIDDSIFPLSITGWIAVIGLAVFSEVIGHGLVVYSLKYFSSAFVTIVLLLEPAPAAGIAWVLFGEFLDPFNILGFILITLGIYLAKTGEGSDGGDKQNPPPLVQQELVQTHIEP